jgi:anti-sigma-K factor RskA
VRGGKMKCLFQNRDRPQTEAEFQREREREELLILRTERWRAVIGVIAMAALLVLALPVGVAATLVLLDYPTFAPLALLAGGTLGSLEFLRRWRRSGGGSA